MNMIEIPSVNTVEQAIQFRCADFMKVNENGSNVLRALRDFQFDYGRGRKIIYNRGESINI